MFVHVDTIEGHNEVQVHVMVSDDIDLDVTANYNDVCAFARESASVSEDYRIAEVDALEGDPTVCVVFMRD